MDQFNTQKVLFISYQLPPALAGGRAANNAALAKLMKRNFPIGFSRKPFIGFG